VPEVNAAFQQLPHGDDRSHAGVPFPVVRLPASMRDRFALVPERPRRE
jgi:hypothetical protein